LHINVLARSPAVSRLTLEHYLEAESIEDMIGGEECEHTNPYTWSIDYPIVGRVYCFGCCVCGAAWTRQAPEGLQPKWWREEQKERKRQERAAKAATL
jgi:hypothetical protein